MENLLLLIKQALPIGSIILASNVIAFTWMKIKNKPNDKIEIMNVRSELRKIRRIEEVERNNKIF